MQRHLAILGALLVMATAVQAWLVTRSAAPAQDVVRVADLAQHYVREGRRALAAQDEAAAAVLLAGVHRARVGWLNADPRDWATSAQRLAATAIVVSIVPAYWILLQLASLRIAVVGTALFAVSGSAPLLGADGQADAVHLCLALAALAALLFSFGRFEPQAVQARVPTSLGRIAVLACAGALAGLATHLRTEAWFVPVIATLCAVALPATSFRQRSRRLVLVVAVMGAGLLVAQAATAAMLGTATPAAQLWLQVAARQRPPRAVEVDRTHRDEAMQASADVLLPSGQPWVLDDKERSGSRRTTGVRATIAELGQELPAAVGVPTLLLAAWGATCLRRVNLTPLAVVLSVATGFVVLAAGGLLATKAGYLSARHLVLLSLPVCLMAAIAIQQLHDAIRRQPRFVRHAAACTLGALVVLPIAIEQPHASRGAYRAAGLWLRTAHTEGRVLDTRGWSLLYSGRPTYRFDRATEALADPQLQYLVVERRELVLDSARSRSLAWLVAEAGHRVAQFPLPGSAETKTVEVYELHAERVARLTAALHR